MVGGRVIKNEIVILGFVEGFRESEWSILLCEEHYWSVSQLGHHVVFFHFVPLSTHPAVFLTLLSSPMSPLVL